MPLPPRSSGLGGGISQSPPLPPTVPSPIRSSSLSGGITRTGTERPPQCTSEEPFDTLDCSTTDVNLKKIGEN